MEGCKIYIADLKKKSLILFCVGSQTVNVISNGKFINGNVACAL